MATKQDENPPSYDALLGNWQISQSNSGGQPPDTRSNEQRFLDSLISINDADIGVPTRKDKIVESVKSFLKGESQSGSYENQVDTLTGKFILYSCTLSAAIGIFGTIILELSKHDNQFHVYYEQIHRFLSENITPEQGPVVITGLFALLLWTAIGADYVKNPDKYHS